MHAGSNHHSFALAPTNVAAMQSFNLTGKDTKLSSGTPDVHCRRQTYLPALFSRYVLLTSTPNALPSTFLSCGSRRRVTAGAVYEIANSKVVYLTAEEHGLKCVAGAVLFVISAPQQHMWACTCLRKNTD